MAGKELLEPRRFFESAETMLANPQHQVTHPGKQHHHNQQPRCPLCHLASFFAQAGCHKATFHGFFSSDATAWAPCGEAESRLVSAEFRFAGLGDGRIWALRKAPCSIRMI